MFAMLPTNGVVWDRPPEFDSSGTKKKKKHQMPCVVVGLECHENVEVKNIQNPFKQKQTKSTSMGRSTNPANANDPHTNANVNNVKTETKDLR